MKTKNKDHTISFRCDAEQYRTLIRRAEISNRSLSDFCRLAALKAKVLPIRRLSEQEQQFFSTLQQHNHNFTLIGNLIRAHNPQLYTAIAEHLQRSKQLFNLFFKS